MMVRFGPSKQNGASQCLLLSFSTDSVDRPNPLSTARSVGRQALIHEVVIAVSAYHYAIAIVGLPADRA